MTNDERTDWVTSLKEGDEVGIYKTDEAYRWIYVDRIKHITKGGKIRLEKGTLFRPDGTKCSGTIYKRRVIGPVVGGSIGEW